MLVGSLQLGLESAAVRDAPPNEPQPMWPGVFGEAAMGLAVAVGAYGVLSTFLDVEPSAETAFLAGLGVFTSIRASAHRAGPEHRRRDEESIDAGSDAYLYGPGPESIGDAEPMLRSADWSALWTVPLGYGLARVVDLDVQLAHAYAAAILLGITLGVVYQAVAKRWTGSRNDPG